jgi:hypothetical protein
VTSVPSYQYTYYTSGATPLLNSPYLDNVIQFAPNITGSFGFSSRIIGQRFTFIRSVIDLTSGMNFFYNATSLPYRVFNLNGVITDMNVNGINLGMTYTYAGQQKIRSVFLVVASPNVNFSFDLIEIS